MVKLIVGLKGSGKTKMLIDLVNSTVDNSKGSVVCIEKGTKLLREISYKARLIDTDEYGVATAQALLGFVGGVVASDHDASDVFIDSALKICQDDIAAFENFILGIEKLGEAHNVCFTLTSSIKAEEVPESVRKLIINS